MTDTEYLQTFDLTLTAAAPVYIGSGKTILKNSYLFNSHTGKISVFDEQKFFDLIYRNRLIDRYEQFMLSGNQNLYAFLTKECQLTEKDWLSAVRYTVNVQSALDDAHSLKDICAFIRDAMGRVYVPGSSVKGALRTILLFQMIKNDASRRDAAHFDEKHFDKDLTEKYLHTLHLNKKKTADAVNSIMRGIYVSDSAPVPDEFMTLSIKNDVCVDGSVNRVAAVCRECIAPNSEFTVKLTLDQSILKGRITKESILTAINSFDQYYEKTYAAMFAQPEKNIAMHYHNVIFLGGGAGFFSKALVYPYFGKPYALKITSEMMQRKFRKHHHERDESLGISPHMMKYTEYNSRLYPMGMCRAEIK